MLPHRSILVTKSHKAEPGQNIPRRQCQVPLQMHKKSWLLAKVLQQIDSDGFGALTTAAAEKTVAKGKWRVGELAADFWGF